MNIVEFILLSLALTLDGFLISIPIGINKKIKLNKKVYFPIFFFVFAFLFTIIGNFLADELFSGLGTILDIIGGGVLAVMGIQMIKEGRDVKRQDVKPKEKKVTLLSVLIYTISGSLDCFVVGVSQFQGLSFETILFYSLIIASVSGLLSVLGLLIGKTLGTIKIVEEYADEIGGIILIVFGIVSMSGII